MPSVVPQLLNARVEPAASTTPSVALKVKRATVTFDRTWSPYIQGSLVCQLLSAADATTTDPRKGLTTKFTLTQSIDGGAAQQLPLVAWLRGRSNDFATAEATLTFAGVESLMNDALEVVDQQYSVSVSDTTFIADAIDVMRWVPAAGAPPYPISAIRTIDGTGSFTIAQADAAWSAGASAWSVINGVEEDHGVWIRGDETGTAVLRMGADYSADTSTHLITGSDRVIAVTDSIDRDNPDWANMVFINYPNSANNFTDYGYAAGSSGVPIKAIVINRQSKKTASGGATTRATRAGKRGRNLAVTAIADLTCRPNQTYRVQFRGYDWTGKVQSVSFRYPEGLMDMTINIIES